MMEEIEAAKQLAEELCREAATLETWGEKRQKRQLARMMDDPLGKALTTAITDQCLRSKNWGRIADQISYLLQTMGIPRYLSFFKRGALTLFLWLRAPKMFVPLLQMLLRRETRKLILPGETKALIRHIKKRRKEGVSLNLNHLGEAILGEEEAKRRFQVYLEDLKNPAIDTVSIKISTIYSQINLIAWEASLEVLSRRFRELLRATPKKSVNLDMEEYRDLALTVAVFKKVLSEKEFSQQSAGIALQAYLPESYLIQQELTLWARTREAPIKIRLVKGANLGMEKVEASLRGWLQAPFTEKGDVDAQFKQMVRFGLRPENARAVKIGIGSHNLFDIAYALILAKKEGTENEVVFEMLEGMSDPVRRALQQRGCQVLLYGPAVKKEEFAHALAYLVRRLDENTAEENFLRHAFQLVPGSAAWEREAAKFEASCQRQVPSLCRRQLKKDKGRNEPDTDVTLEENRIWASQLLVEWKDKAIEPIPLVIGGKIRQGRLAWGRDPSFPQKERFEYALADREGIEEALKSAKAPEKHVQVAAKLREKRKELIGAMMLNTGKTFFEADTEVSEAIDFAEYYRPWPGLQGKGLTLVAPPWNFPCSIPAGSILGALAAGNPVIFKPAQEAVLVGWILVQALWEAGVSKEALQFVVCEDDPEGSQMVQDARVKIILLTGSAETARRLMGLQRGFPLMAETGGKNAIIVSQMADRDLAVRDIVQSAFGHAGQKCSACSLAILHREVYEDPLFKKQLLDAASSLKVGSQWDPATKVNPLIASPSPHLMRALTSLESGETWLLKPKGDLENPQLFSPGIKWGVQPGSFTHLTEFFGPLLGVIPADSLPEAIEIANQTPYGLTSGLHTLDDREVILWRERILAGNLYVNRGITGAIVNRQPFGGTKASQFGPGAKAGGPNYVLQLTQRLQGDGEDNYVEAWEKTFSQTCDLGHLYGQDNLFYYVPHEFVILRLQPSDDPKEIARVKKACQICNTPLEISQEETEEAFIERLSRIKFPRIRLLSSPSSTLEKALNALGATVHLAPAVADGRLELLHYLREVSFSYDTHRYGQIFKHP